MTVSVLLVVTTLLIIRIAAEERERALDRKTVAATMVTDLFAASVAAGVVFSDGDAIKGTVDNLRRTEDVVGGVVYQKASSTPAASFGDIALPPAVRPGVEIRGDRLIVAQDIVDHEDHVVGATRVAFSLERENAAFVQRRRDLAVGGVAVMLVTAAILIAITRVRIVAPLMRLADTARTLERGQLGERAPVDGAVEIETLARAFNSMSEALALRERDLKKELQVAASLQTSILPKTMNIAGVEIAASMKPATEVGGDYYDVIPTPDGCVIGVGDVSGHGLGAGVIMLMIQSVVASLVAAKPDVSPVEIELVVNRVLHENIRKRMGRNDHATLSILRYTRDGRLRFAGAHEELIVYRAGTGQVETVATPGTWVGIKADVSAHTPESEVVLGPGDFLVLHTDGVTEAWRGRELFGFDRLVEAVKNGGKGSAAELHDAVVDAVGRWADRQADDVSVLVLRHLGKPDLHPNA